jgi:hypothetical protein
MLPLLGPDILLSTYFALRTSVPFLETKRGNLYRVGIKSFPDYKYLLQKNYVEYKRSTY